METVRPWEWDWSAIAAFFAAAIVLVGTVVTYFSNREAQRSSAKIELLVLSERWAEDVREHSSKLLMMWSYHVQEEGKTREQLVGKQKVLEEIRLSLHRLSLLLPRDHPKTIRILQICQSTDKILGSNSPSDFIRAIQEIIEDRQEHILNGKNNAKNK